MQARKAVTNNNLEATTQKDSILTLACRVTTPDWLARRLAPNAILLRLMTLHVLNLTDSLKESKVGSGSAMNISLNNAVGRRRVLKCQTQFVAIAKDEGCVVGKESRIAHDMNQGARAPLPCIKRV